jgi:creatinine amidohydrolase/Fe(II)-dependent formamide hydrolase-like protein
LAAAGLLVVAGLAVAAPSSSVFVEDLTWVELRDRVAAGAAVALVPIGGTEQNGPHMVLGKHNVRVRLLAERIARRHGAALVAPVVALVPEGAIDPPSQHMRWPGTLSVPEAAFESVLESTARSLLHAGFTDVVLLGDHGGYRRSLERVAARMPHVHALPEYYRASVADFDRQLRQRGYSDAEIGLHAGLSDTALTMALDPSLVRNESLPLRAPTTRGDGVEGDPRRAAAAAAELGREAVEHVVDVAVAAIRQRTAAKTQSVTRP